MAKSGSRKTLNRQVQSASELRRPDVKPLSAVIRGEFSRKERQGTARPLMFVVLDELNKYAPREGDSPIKQILSNCAIKVAGRLDAARPEAAIRSLPGHPRRPRRPATLLSEPRR